MTAAIYTKSEITEMITRQYDIGQDVINHIISKMIDLSDEEVMREFTKASKGTLISKVENGFQIEFINANVFLSELWIDLVNNN